MQFIQFLLIDNLPQGNRFISMSFQFKQNILEMFCCITIVVHFNLLILFLFLCHGKISWNYFSMVKTMKGDFD